MLLLEPRRPGPQRALVVPPLPRLYSEDMFWHALMVVVSLMRGLLKRARIRHPRCAQVRSGNRRAILLYRDSQLPRITQRVDTGTFVQVPNLTQGLVHIYLGRICELGCKTLRNRNYVCWRAAPLTYMHHVGHRSSNDRKTCMYFGPPYLHKLKRRDRSRRASNPPDQVLTHHVARSPGLRNSNLSNSRRSSASRWGSVAQIAQAPAPARHIRTALAVS